MTNETEKFIEDVLKEAWIIHNKRVPYDVKGIEDLCKIALKLFIEKMQEENKFNCKVNNLNNKLDLDTIPNLYLDGIKDATILSKVFQFEEGIKEGKRQMEEENNHLNQNGSKNDDNFAKVKFPSGSEYIKEISLALKEFEKNVKNIPFSGLIHYGVQSDYYDKLIQLLHTGKLGEWLK